MLSRNDLQKLAEVRLEDSIILFNAGKSSSAYYLAGYCIELALKACISKLFQADVIPDKDFVQAVYTHSLESLLNVAGLLFQLKEDAKSDPQLAAYWGIASKWNEASRYHLWDQVATATLIQSIQDPNHGVFQWVKKHW
jgi:HEPN domain-containing protein